MESIRPAATDIGKRQGRLLITASVLLTLSVLCAVFVHGVGKSRDDSDGGELELLLSRLASRAAAGSTSLRFGDGSFRPSSSSSSREGSVRAEEKKLISPDFQPPIGSLGSTGLHKTDGRGFRQELSLSRADPYKPQLAFGDADGFKASQDTAVRANIVSLAPARACVFREDSDNLTKSSSCKEMRSGMPYLCFESRAFKTEPRCTAHRHPAFSARIACASPFRSCEYELV